VAVSALKIGVFGFAGAITAQVLALAVLIGGIAFPSSFLARALVRRLPMHIHTRILDLAVVTGGGVMIADALRHLI
jgi:hypothetical protein